MSNNAINSSSEMTQDKYASIKSGGDNQPKDETKTKDDDIKDTTRTRVPGVDSEILDTFFYESLTKVLFSQPVKFKLSYRASSDGFTPESFHRNCRGATYTITLLSLQGGIVVAGFTTESFDGEGFKTDKYASVINLMRGKRYKVNNPSIAILVGPDMFPTFGEGDLVIGAKVTSNFPNTYGSTLDTSFELMEGKDTAVIKEMEVFIISRK